MGLESVPVSEALCRANSFEVCYQVSSLENYCQRWNLWKAYNIQAIEAFQWKVTNKITEVQVLKLLGKYVQT